MAFHLNFLKMFHLFLFPTFLRWKINLNVNIKIILLKLNNNYLRLERGRGGTQAQ